MLKSTVVTYLILGIRLQNKRGRFLIRGTLVSRMYTALQEALDVPRAYS